MGNLFRMLFFSDRVLRIFSEPLSLPKKLITRLHWKIISLYFNSAPYVKEQVEVFDKLDLDFKSSEDILNDVYSKFPFLDCDEGSCHHHFFAACSRQKAVNNILEIGTYTGHCAALLSELFPSAMIDTIDLPDDHPVFSFSYDRRNKVIREKFIENRNTLLASKNNVNFLQIDSQRLTLIEDKKYDLIWIDGAHGYPVVTIDIVNSLRLLNKGGVIACDDVWTAGRKRGKLYDSMATYETLRALKSANVIDFELIHKRLNNFHLHPRYRKYIAICRVKD